MQKPSVTVDWREFRKGWTTLEKNYGLAVALGFRALAKEARDEVRDRARREFRLHSDFIPKGVLSIPMKSTQVRKAAKSVQRFHDLTAAVFLRPSSTPRRSLAFMVPQEEGGSKTSQDGGGMIAIPTTDLKAYNYKTAKGGVRKRWKPGTLLEEYNRVGPNRKGAKLQRRGKRGKGVPFIMKTSKGLMITRRRNSKRNSLEFLYVLKKRAEITARWNFEPTVAATVRNRYRSIIPKYLDRMRRGMPLGQ